MASTEPEVRHLGCFCSVHLVSLPFYLYDEGANELKPNHHFSFNEPLGLTRN